MTHQVCTDCKSKKLAWDWANGDLVCTACGLVAQERFIDERVSYRDFDEFCPMTNRVLTQKPIDHKIVQQTNVMNAMLLNGMLDNTTDIARAVDDFCNKPPTVDVDVSKKAHITCGIYAKTQGLDVKDLCHQMNIKTSAFWKATTRNGISEVPERRFQDVLKRAIYKCPHIPAKQEWQVFKIANKFLEAINKTPHMQNTKPDRLIVSLMIIACEIKKIPINRVKVCKQYKLSAETLNKHEILLQEVLTHTNQKT
jgi:transcription initiation factor TFIIIB Brf1 subunit/transcription initiation factor TFIIB